MKMPFPAATTSTFFFFLLLISPLLSIAMADSSSAPPSSAVHIVYTEQPPPTEQPEAYHLRTLTSVLGSEEAAKESLVYSYKTAASGFSAKLTPEQVAQISKLPGVLQVVPSRKLELHNPAGKGMLH